MKKRYWSMSSVDTASPEVVEWYAEEVLPAAAADDRVNRAWLLETTFHVEETGPNLPQLFAVYESREVESGDGVGALDDVYIPDVGEWDAAPGPVERPRTSVREVLANLWFPSDGGEWWCSIRIDPIDTDDARENWEEIERWYTFRHLGETLVGEGLHQGWRLGHEVAQSGPTALHDHFRWAMYEQTKQEDMLLHVNKEPLQPIWFRFVDQESFGRGYHRVVGRA